MARSHLRRGWATLLLGMIAATCWAAEEPTSDAPAPSESPQETATPVPLTEPLPPLLEGEGLASKEILVDSLPLSPTMGRTTRSPGLVFGMSALMPGAGQLYMNRKRGIAYLVAEAGLLIGYVLTHRDAENLRDDYVNEVRENVKFDGEGSFEQWTMEDYEHATLFENWHNVYTDDNGDPLARVGKFYWKDREEFKTADPQLDPDAIPASELRQAALDLRTRSNDRFKTASTFAGFLLFNHLASAVEGMIGARRAASSEPALSLRIEPEFSGRETLLRLSALRRF